LRTSKSKIDTIGRESDDQKLVKKSHMQWLLQTLLKYVAKASETEHGCQMVSINLKFNGIFVVFPERRHMLPKMNWICLEVITSTFKPVEFIALPMVALTSLQYEENLSEK